MSKKRIIFMSISIMGMLLVLMGTSYAFFMYSKTGEKQNEMATGIFQVSFQEESGAIYLRNAYPMKDDEGQNLESFNFSVENKGDITAKYQISIVEDENNTLNRSSLRYELKKQGEEGTISNLNDLVIRDNVTLEGLQKDTYELRIWLDENTGNEAMGKTWKGKVQVVAEESKAYAFEDYIAPTIKLNGERVMNVTKKEEFNDPGVESVSDNVDVLSTNDVTKRYEYFNGESTSVVDGVNTNQEGVYVIYYELLDSRGNKGVAARTINVVQVNSNPPVVTLNGESEVNLYVDESYEDKGASARDELGTELPVLVFGSYNTKSFGDYIINYFAIDKDGNIGGNTRTIHVKVYEDPVGANRPELTDGLIPVYYDEDNQVWRKANKYGKWFSYGEQWWGNAVTINRNKVWDVSGKGNYGEIRDAKVEDGIAKLDGVDDCIDVGFSNYDFSNGITLILRVKFNSIKSDGSAYLFGNWEGAGGGLLYNGSDLSFDLYINDSTNKKNYKKIVYTVPDNNELLEQYNTIIATYDGNVMKLFFNGTEVGTISFTGSVSSSNCPFFIGANPNGQGGSSAVNFSDVSVSDSLLFERAITEQEVLKYSDDTIEVENKEDLLFQYDFNYKNEFEVNDYIPMEIINTMWVWVPRYEYDYVNMANFANGTQAEPGAIGIRFLNNTSASEGGNYMLHPAFKFGDEELKGFWYGKFESSEKSQSCVATDQNVNQYCDLVTLIPQVKPNVTSWRAIRPVTSFTVTQKMTKDYKNEYGFSGTEDTHMSKNSEWGAVTYLSQSIYGKKGYDGGKVYINNCQNYTTGIAGDTPDAVANDTCTNTYEKKEGQQASTTGNIYGIYDMNGGAYEYVMGVLSDEEGNPRSGYTLSANSGFNGKLRDNSDYSQGIDFPNSKYYDLYKGTDVTTACNNGVCYGHALSETASWYGSYYDFITITHPWVTRGGHFGKASLSGIFYMAHNLGTSYNSISFRIVLVP